MARKPYAQRIDHPLLDAVVGVAGAVAALGCGLLLRDAAGLGASTPVLAVVFAMTLSRRPLGAVAFALVPLLGAVGAGVGLLMVSAPVAGDTVFALGLAAPVWLRRFGVRASRAGALLTTALIGILVIPVHIGGGAAGAGWAAVTALAALA
ncbi:hypothetical protein, partial [Streptomyces fuscigenes]|uniref:hypothetical protein n=1 Tax=Streptomyces fuscigenes TaxID=1528880 RepID=UPI0035577F15|nr:hypothetical protein [Streptomyces fuscigenes]